MAQMTLRIDGMSCMHCVRAVRTALSGVPGITSADVGIGGATIEHDGSVTLQQVSDAVSVAGYEVAGGDDNRRRLPTI